MRNRRATLLGLALLLGLGVSAARGDEPKPATDAKPSAAPVASRVDAPVLLAERLRGLLGIVVILGLAYALSTDRRAVSGRVLFWGLTLQWAFALLVLRLPAGEKVLSAAGDAVKAVL